MMRIRLLQDEGDGLAFLADLCRRIAAIAPADTVLTPSASPSVHGEHPTEYVVDISDLSARLMAEVGRHRAQLIPAGSNTGRIATSIVTVEIAAPTTPAAGAGAPIVKTYNYPLGTVFDHSTGARLRLEDVLAGQG
jgi:protein subunit release factor A